MKSKSLTAILLGAGLVASLAATIRADDSAPAYFASKKVPDTGSEKVEKELLKLYREEAANPKSKLAVYLDGLRKQNPDYTIDATIDASQVFRIDSGRSGATFDVDYLIIVQAGFKSNTFPVGFLKADIGLLGEGAAGSKDVVTITGPSRVTIGGETY